jgi:hypothetical protein
MQLDRDSSHLIEGGRALNLLHWSRFGLGGAVTTCTDTMIYAYPSFMPHRGLLKV